MIEFLMYLLGAALGLLFLVFFVTVTSQKGGPR